MKKGDIKKVKELAELIQNSKHIVIHAGAGISTSASIPDFRGPTGVWTMMDKGEEPDLGVEFEEALPTLTHMALVELQNQDMIKYVVSQNVDGLFLRCGIAPELLSELHGNIYLEICKNKKCGMRYLREFDAAIDGNDKTHATGRFCTKCEGKLYDSIINFGEDLPGDDLQRAEEHSSQADLSIVIGSSLQVTPACNLPAKTLKNKGKLVIINLMDTPYDDDCAIRIHAKADEVFRELMRQLELPIPSYRWNLNVWIGNTIEYEEEKKSKKKRTSSENYTYTLHVAGDCGYQTNLIHKVEILQPKKPSKKSKKEKSTETEWLEIDGTGEGIFEFSGSSEDLTQDPEHQLKIHFLPRLNVEPHELKYKLGLETKKIYKGSFENFAKHMTFPIHLKTIQHK